MFVSTHKDAFINSVGLILDIFGANHENILLIGPPGVGKTHLAVAFGMEAIQRGFNVLYRSIFDIAADVVSHQERLIEYFIKPQLLILDELGMKNLNQFSERPFGQSMKSCWKFSI